MITLRYHLITIAAIFLSLGLGIILGGSIGQNWINEKQQTLLAGLEKKYDQAVKSNGELQQQLTDLSIRIEETNNEFSRLVSSDYLPNLQGKKIGFWQQPGLKADPLKQLFSSVGLKIVELEEVSAKPEEFPYPIIFLGEMPSQWALKPPEKRWIHLPKVLITPAKQWELLRDIQLLYKENKYEY